MQHVDFNYRDRQFSLEQFAQAAADALENWDWSIEDEERGDHRFVLKMKEALDFGDEPVEYVRTTFADDDGFVRLADGERDVWDKLYEFAVSTAGASE